MKKIILMLLIITGAFMVGCASRQNQTAPNDAGNQTEVASITEEDAKNIVLEQVPGAAEQDIREFRKDYDDGRLEYEGKIIYEGIEYEFEVDGYSGAVLVWDVEPVND